MHMLLPIFDSPTQTPCLAKIIGIGISFGLDCAPPPKKTCSYTPMYTHLIEVPAWITTSCQEWVRRGSKKQRKMAEMAGSKEI